MKSLRALVFALCIVFISTTYAHAGTIDPRGVGNWKALFENTALSANPTLNMGKFTTQSAYNITVSDTELRGFAWGEGTGWIIMNCADTTSGCSGTNGNFRVANDGSGNLSGYAWGENTGWINFGPFTNPAISTVKITNGFFGGTLGDAGYAWVQNYGWLKFDCSDSDSCTETDWGVTGGTCSDGIQNQNETGVDIGGVCGNTTTGGSTPTCFDGIQNQNETAVDTGGVCTPPLPSCFDNIQNQNETGVDTGGVCEKAEIESCFDSIQNQNETSVDRGGVCGGDPDPSPSCSDGIRNQNETEVDKGGVCGICAFWPTLPTCKDVGPGGPNPDIRIPIDGDNPIIRWLTWAGLSLPVASAIVSFLVSNPIALKDLPLLAVQLWNSLLIALGWKERKKPWGVVYDSVTKHPIDPAYVVLMDMAGNEVATAITDMNGRYGFAVDPGTYKIVANKSNYQFPSARLAGKSSDGLYDELYFGGDVVVSKEGEIITKNIPLDQLAFDWNEYTKTHGGTYGMKLAFYRTGDIFLYHLSRILFMIGFAYSVYAFVFSPILYNAIVFALYIIMALFQLLAPGFHKKGSVLSKNTKKPLPFSVVRIISAVTNQEVAHKVADRVGNYYGLVQNGLYTFAVDTKKPAEEGYDKHPVDKYVKVKKGYLKETFKI